MECSSDRRVRSDQVDVEVTTSCSLLDQKYNTVIEEGQKDIVIAEMLWNKVTLVGIDLET